MAADNDLIALKQRLSPHLLEVDGVSGVGVGGDRLNVYLEEDTQRIRDQVGKIIGEHAPNATVSFVVTGGFRAL